MKSLDALVHLGALTRLHWRASAGRAIVQREGVLTSRKIRPDRAVPIHVPVQLQLLGVIAALVLLCAAIFPKVLAGQNATAARFVASSRGQVFYALSCDAWKRLRKSNLRYFQSATEAVKAGYRPSTADGCSPQLDTALIKPSIGGRADCVVSRIIDGDTFQCQGGSRVRFLLVDADELNQSVYSDSAIHILERTMGVGKRVRLDFDIDLSDRYDRLLAYVYADSIFVNRELARRGFAQVAVYPSNVSRIDIIRAAADSARQEKRGVWSGSAFECSPADYRAGKCRR